MGCTSDRKTAVVRPEQKWDYISLQDFKSTSCFTPVAYAYLWVSLLISLAVYAVDIFTAVNIFAFNRFFQLIEVDDLLIDRNLAKWIVSICIILTIINLIYEYIRAWKVMKRGSVAEAYLDNIAVRAESSRLGSGQGWRRFLVFAELTKSKKGAEYVALFTYFSFQSWFRTIVCAGPRQFVNVIFIIAYASQNFLIGEQDNLGEGFLSLFDKIRATAEAEPRTALVLSGMVFTIVLFVFSFLFILIGVFCYVFFLWHWIPRSDGGLSGYCERKINKRLMSIVSVKVNKAIAKEEQARLKAGVMAAKKNGEQLEERKATLPTFMQDNDKLPAMPTLQKADTFTTLPAYSSRPGSSGSSFEMGNLDRTNTQASAVTSNMSSKTTLLGSAAGMGYRSDSPAPSLPSLDTGSLQSPARSYGTSPLGARPNNAGQYGSGYNASPSAYSSDTMVPRQGPSRAESTVSSAVSFSRPSPGPAMGYRTESPAPTLPSLDMGPSSSLPRSVTGSTARSYAQGPSGRPPYAGGGQSGYVTDYSSTDRTNPAQSHYSQPSNVSSSARSAAYGQGREQMRSATGPVPPRGQQYQQQPSRNMTAPIQARQQQQPDYNGSGYGSEYDYNEDVESQRGPGRY